MGDSSFTSRTETDKPRKTSEDSECDYGKRLSLLFCIIWEWEALRARHTELIPWLLRQREYRLLYLSARPQAELSK